MSILFYRRPSFVERPDGPLSKTECQRMVERTSNGRRAIPDELSFENILSNKALPPCSLRDFMDYLVYISHDAENLQFYLWLQDYTQRFNALKPERKALAPEWKDSSPAPEQMAAQVAAPQRGRKKKPGPLVPKIDFDNLGEPKGIAMTEVVAVSPKQDSPMDSKRTAFPSGNDNPISPTKSTFDEAYNRGSSLSPNPARLSYRSQPEMTEESVRELTDEANTQAGLKWQAFSVQPLRPEIDRVIAHYIAPGAPRELNLSSRDRSTVLHALQHTTHPSAFGVVADMVEATLRGQSHPNFVRWAICNGNQPRVFFVRTMGVSHIAAGLIIGLLLALSHASRWWRIFMFPVLFIGTTTMIAAYKGLCVILHHTHNRNVHPWEELGSISSGVTGSPGMNSNDAIDTSKKAVFDDEEATLAGSMTRSDAATPNRPWSMDTFGSSNTFQNEPWVSQYKKKPLMRKVFDNETWVQEESIRIIQDKIVKQSQVWSVFLTTVATVVFVAVPAGNFY